MGRASLPFEFAPTRLRPDSNCFPKISCLGSTSLSRVALVFPRRQIARSAKRMRRLTRLGGTSNTPAVRRVKGSRHLPLPAAGAVSELWGGSYGSSASICRLVRSGLRLLGSTASTLPFHSVIRIVAPDCWPLLTPVAWWEIEPFVSRDVSHSTPNNR